MNKQIFLGFVIMILLAANVNADLEGATFKIGKDMAINYIAGGSPIAAKAAKLISFGINYVQCPNCAATNLALSAISEVSPELGNSITTLLDPSGVLKNEVKEFVFNQLDPDSQLFFNTLQGAMPYMQEAFKDNPEAIENLEVVIDGDTIVYKNKDGSVFASFPKGMIGKQDKNGKWVFTGSQSLEGILNVGNVEFKSLGKDDVIEYFENEDGKKELKVSKGDMKVGNNPVNNIKGGEFIVDKNGQIEKAKFEATEATTYNFNSQTKTIQINALAGSTVDFNSDSVNGGKVQGSNIDLEYSNQEGSDKQIFSGKDVTVEWDYTTIHSANLGSEGGSYKEAEGEKYVLDIKSNKGLNIYFKKGIECYESSDVSCIQRDVNSRYLAVNAIGDNEINIYDEDNEIGGLNVYNIKDNSQVIYKESYKEVETKVDKTNEIIFSKGAYKVSKDTNINELPFLKVSFDKNDGENKVNCAIFSNFDRLIEECGADSLATTISDTADSYYEEHMASIRKYGVGTYGGENSYYYKILDEKIKIKDSKGKIISEKYLLEDPREPKALLYDMLMRTKRLCNKDPEVCLKEAASFEGKSQTEVTAYYTLRNREGYNAEEAKKELTRRIKDKFSPDHIEIQPDQKIKKTNCIDFVYEDVLKKSVNSFLDSSEQVKYNYVHQVYKQSRKDGLKVTEALHKQGWKYIMVGDEEYRNKGYPGLGKPDKFYSLEEINNLINDFSINGGVAIIPKYNKKTLEVEIPASHILVVGRDQKTDELNVIENHWDYGPVQQFSPAIDKQTLQQKINNRKLRQIAILVAPN